MVTEENALQVLMARVVEPFLTPIIQTAVREEVARLSTMSPTQDPPKNRIGGIDLAMEVTHKAESTIYNLVCAGKIPHSKQSGKLYFSESELLEWIRSGNRKSNSEINKDVDSFLGRRGGRRQIT